jgi:hypothetical protein
MSGLSTVDIAWVCLSGLLTADIGPIEGRRRARWQQALLEFVCRARRRQTSGPLTADIAWVCLSGPLTADVGYVDGRRRATFWNLSVWPVDGRRRARWRQMSGPLTADVELPLGILSVWPVDGRRRASRRQTTICRRRAPDERRCRFCCAPF